MKKNILIVILAIIVVVTGCEKKDRYTQERAFWKANKLAMKIINDPEKTKPIDFQTAINLYKDFIKDYNDSNFTPQAHFAIARLYIAKDDFIKARSYYAEMKEIYKEAPDILADIGFSIGNSFELEGYWDEALDEYKKVMEQYTITKRSLELPFHIIKHYKDKNDVGALQDAYQMAVSHYQNIIKARPDASLVYACKGLIAHIYLDQKNWEQALNYLRVITSPRYKDYLGQDEYIFTIALIYHGQLDDKENALKYLERLRRDYPESYFAKSAKELIKQINQ